MIFVFERKRNTVLLLVLLPRNQLSFDLNIPAPGMENNADTNIVPWLIKTKNASVGVFANKSAKEKKVFPQFGTRPGLPSSPCSPRAISSTIHLLSVSLADALALVLRNVRHGVFNDPDELRRVVDSSPAPRPDNTLVARAQREHIQVSWHPSDYRRGPYGPEPPLQSINWPSGTA